jgi:hypothetical protein
MAADYDGGIIGWFKQAQGLVKPVASIATRPVTTQHTFAEKIRE